MAPLGADASRSQITQCVQPAEPLGAHRVALGLQLAGRDRWRRVLIKQQGLSCAHRHLQQQGGSRGGSGLRSDLRLSHPMPTGQLKAGGSQRHQAPAARHLHVVVVHCGRRGSQAGRFGGRCEGPGPVGAFESNKIHKQQWNQGCSSSTGSPQQTSLPPALSPRSAPEAKGRRGMAEAWPCWPSSTSRPSCGAAGTAACFFTACRRRGMSTARRPEMRQGGHQSACCVPVCSTSAVIAAAAAAAAAASQSVC